MCEFFTTRYEQISDLQTPMQAEIMESEINDTDPKEKRDYNGRPSKHVLSVRHPYCISASNQFSKLRYRQAKRTTY